MVSTFLWAIYLQCFIQSSAAFRVTLRDEDWMAAVLEPSDLRDNVTEYAALLAGEPHPRLVPFLPLPADGSLPPPLVLNVTHPGLAYRVALLARDGRAWTRPLRSVGVLTQPLPVDSATISDYREAPETGVVFEISSPPNNVFSRVNISYVEGSDLRSMLYKDFYRGKTVFKHWLPGLCYRNVTFQLISEATINRTAVVRHSGVTHRALQHRTVPNPPRNITWKLVPLSQEGAALPPGHPPQPRQARDVPLLEEEFQGEVHADEEEYPSEEAPTEPPTQNATATAAADDYAYANATATANDGGVANGNETAEADEDSAFRTRPFTWPAPTGTPPPPADRAAEGEEFVNGLLPEYEDSNEPGSALGNVTETATVDVNTHEFFTEPTEPGTYRVLVTALSSAGDCEARESSSYSAFTFYLSGDLSARDWLTVST
ncbi:receptor-type tyrosine-protein phosphatase O-like [Gadus chalcogrammus]|uniref:receptor-type tyrosine-protein phosphatase O-like n=1 Tax=Gadus chalcogrammus TaxID=1042646 RepID=UPI0024C442B6|nr:receptor-type tyrosine-protein phosphatase O-like [Gadus chalcogrammus]